MAVTTVAADSGQPDLFVHVFGKEVIVQSTIEVKAAFHGTVFCRMPSRHFIRKHASENRSLYFVSCHFHDADKCRAVNTTYGLNDVGVIFTGSRMRLFSIAVLSLGDTERREVHIKMTCHPNLVTHVSDH